VNDAADHGRDRYNEEKHELVTWMSDNKIESDLLNRVLNFVHFRETHKHHYFDVAKIAMFNELTEPMKNELKIQLFLPHLVKLRMFGGKPSGKHGAETGRKSIRTPAETPPIDFFHGLASNMTTSPAAIGDIIVEDGNYGDSLYILLTGAANVVDTTSDPADESVWEDILEVDARDENPTFGVVACLADDAHDWPDFKRRSQFWKVIATNNCDLALIAHDTFVAVLSDTWPEGQAFIQQIAAERGEQLFTAAAAGSDALLSGSAVVGDQPVGSLVTPRVGAMASVWEEARPVARRCGLRQCALSAGRVQAEGGEDGAEAAPVIGQALADTGPSQCAPHRTMRRAAVPCFTLMVAGAVCNSRRTGSATATDPAPRGTRAGLPRR
jgi:hypothetical protein